MKLNRAIMTPAWLSLHVLLLAALGMTMPAVAPTEKRLDADQLEYFPTSDPNGSNTGLLVLPGGGYATLASTAWRAATYLNGQGYDTWVLNYTVTSTNGGKSVYPAPINEAVAAVNRIRSTAAGAALDKLGVIGFSAGGHLAAMTLTNQDVGLDFGILCQPVITMEPPYVHANSSLHLLGPDPSDDLVAQMSAEKRVTASTPPVFVFETADDPVVSSQNSLLFARAMRSAGRPFEILILPDGPHGVGLPTGNAKTNWAAELGRWLEYSI